MSRRKWITTTVRDRNARPAPDLVERNFVAPGPNRLWVADITYIPTWAGFLYLAVVLDAFSRRIVGWAMETHLRTELVLEALNMALAQCRPAGVIHHSDQGTQYTSIAFGMRCRESGVRPSMGSVGDYVDRSLVDISQQTLERRSFHGPAGQTAVIVCGLDQAPSFPSLALDERFAGFALRLQRVEVSLQPFLGWFAGIDPRNGESVS